MPLHWETSALSQGGFQVGPMKKFNTLPPSHDACTPPNVLWGVSPGPSLEQGCLNGKKIIESILTGD